MPDVVSSAIPYLFADDTNINVYTCTYFSPQLTPNQTLLQNDINVQNDINALFHYGNSWHLFFNNTKCAHLHFHFNPSTNTPIYLLHQ